MPQSIPSIIESAVLDETEKALDEFVTAAMNIGISRAQMILMLRMKATTLQGNIIVHEEPEIPQ